MTKITLSNAGDMSKMLLTLATIAALTGLASTAKAGETPPIMDSVTGTQQHVLSKAAASVNASRRSVLTRFPGREGISEGAITSHR